VSAAEIAALRRDVEELRSQLAEAGWIASNAKSAADQASDRVNYLLEQFRGVIAFPDASRPERRLRLVRAAELEARE
jgi:hypothetical protein